MKIFLLYAACALLSGGKSLVFALPMTYFCSRALAETGNPPLTAESGEISSRAEFGVGGEGTFARVVRLSAL